MWHYQPPLRDMRFVIEDVLGLPSEWARLPAFAELDAATASQVLEQAGRFASEVIAPINAQGDEQGCRLVDGRVRTPDGFPAAYQAFVDGGWPALACDPEVGGQGLPQVINAALYEMLAAANHGWTMYPGLLHGAYECLHRHASPELKKRYLGKVVSGEWLATMCLTEAQAGSDLGLIRTRAEPAISGDGSYLVTGNKIFISGGDHDLTDTIVHLVLARLPQAPAGTKGLSLLLVPSRLHEEGGQSRLNAVRCDGLEEKMGIHGSATCVLSLESAIGWLIGEPHRGLAAMFAMMNAARLHVGLQGLGHAEVAMQNALRYAQERLQMRALKRPATQGTGTGNVDQSVTSHAARAPVSQAAVPASTADPIVLHPAMRRTLLDQRVFVEGGRVVAYQAAHLLDIAEQAGDKAERDTAHHHASLLTPVVKAFLTDNGFAVASQALGVFGGYGYVRDYGMEQTLRDSRISMIYEGTNEIQAIDLLVRKVVTDGGTRMNALIDWLAAALPGGALGDRASRLLDQVRVVTGRVVAANADDAEMPLRAAGDYLRLVGLTLLAQAWARADAAAEREGGGHASISTDARPDRTGGAACADPAFLADKRATARHAFDYVLPEAQLRLALIESAMNPLAHIAATSA
ncbi:MAG: Acyl-CoA dehydrogenase domain-like [Rhizobacter sp.]|nr:Acyl-CoA dehydrogenase domain-like [Rhizobacter sp.]